MNIDPNVDWVPFWNLVDKRQPDECWPWLNAPGKGGYGYYSIRGAGKKAMAHRVAWFFTHGPIPNGIKVLHKCDNPPCCNPSHLFTGTQADNVHDCIKKKRDRRCKGEEVHTSVLTSMEVSAIRCHYDPDKTSIAKLARAFKVSEGCITGVVKGKTWKCVPWPNGMPASKLPRAERLRAFAPKGVDHKRAKLTEAKVRAIRSAHEGGADRGQLAKEYGVLRTCIDKIVWRKTWKHVS